MKTSFIILPLLLMAAAALRAQVVADGATNTLSNVTNTISGGVTVGTNGSFTLLVLSDNCLLTNSGFSTIGATATAKSNEVRLVSPTARWLMGASTANPLFIGSNGAANRLVISNGAIASVQANAYLGYISESASNIQAWVTGSNSVWSSAGSITIGLLGSGHQVVLSNGQIQLQATGGLSAFNYTIQAATNLVPVIQWSNIGSAVASGGGVVSFTDTNASWFPMRFYRAISP